MRARALSSAGAEFMSLLFKTLGPHAKTLEHAGDRRGVARRTGRLRAAGRAQRQACALAPRTCQPAQAELCPSSDLAPGDALHNMPRRERTTRATCLRQPGRGEPERLILACDQPALAWRLQACRCDNRHTYKQQQA